MSKTEDRRKNIAYLLLKEKRAIPGSALSEKFGVSRQIIVSDIAWLKRMGYDIISAHNGYIIKNTPLCSREIKLRHTSEQTEDELLTILTLGGTVNDVFVWHKVYGKISVPLGINSMRELKAFMDDIKSGKSSELMHVTAGYHYHTVLAETEEILDEIEGELARKGYLITDKDE